MLKVYKLDDMMDIQRIQLFREIRLHSSLQHRHIIQFYACFLVGPCTHMCECGFRV